MRWDAALKRLPTDRKVRVAEVGVWKGVMSERLLANYKKLRLIQIDRWCEYSYQERIAENYTRFSYKKQESFDEAKKRNENRTKKYKKRIRLIEKDSLTAANDIKNNSLDMVFLDALHSRDGCIKDIIAYIKKIKIYGWIGGHDYHRIGVHKAVNLIFNNKNIEEDSDNTWWVRL